MQTNNQNSNSPINPKLGSSVTNAIKNAEAGELPALDDISNITNRVVEKIKASENILIALSKNPNIDEISAALGLAMILDTMRKHVTAIFSGQVPNVLQFLKPEETFEKTTNSLQDFIIALSKDKVDHISYKIEGDFVKVYVTPYKATIGQSDLSMSHGDYNVDLVICFNVISGDEIDPALSEYGRIMHDATAINLTVDTPGRFAELEWQDSNVSSISEMIVGLADRLGLASFSEQVATALLTGIVASTDHFSNPRTSSNTMSIASKLMSFGANQQLISSQIMEKIKTPAETQASNEVQAPEAIQVPEASVIAATPAVPATPAVTVSSAPVESISVSDSPLDYIEIEPNPNQTLDGQPLESQSTPAVQSFESQISPITQPQEPQPVSQPAPVSQSFESQPTSAPQTIESQSAPIPQSLEPQQAPVYQAPINPAAAAASAVMENNFIQNPEPSLPQPNYTNETPNYQAPVMPTPPLNFAQNLATPQPSSTPFAAPVSLAAPTPLATSAPLTQTASPVTPIPQEQPMQYSAPVQPAQQIQSTQFVQPTQYPEPVSPVQPMQFTAPVSQAQPMPYVEPMQSTPMAAPAEPVQFTQPVQPMAPVPPVQPMEPMQSMPPVPPVPVIFDAASMPNQPLTNDQAFVNSAPVDLMPPMPPMPPEAPSTPDVDFFAQAAAATEAAQLNQSPINSVASSPIPADLDPVSTPAPAPVEAPVDPPLRTFASESPLISQPVDTTAPAAAPIAEPAAIFSPEEPTEPAPAKIDPTAFHIPGM